MDNIQSFDRILYNEWATLSRKMLSFKWLIVAAVAGVFPQRRYANRSKQKYPKQLLIAGLNKCSLVSYK